MDTRRRVRATYDYEIYNDYGKPYIIIVDLDRGMSVTNDIENVVAEIAAKESLDPNKCGIVYRDSTRRWDGWDSKTEKFLSLNAISSIHAIQKLIEHENKKTSQEEAGNSHPTKL